ncbi:MAG: PepSY domain-containing protein [Reyranella sp.]|nr:PepSY domain-containing protein [Reyranella sp.]
MNRILSSVVAFAAGIAATSIAHAQSAPLAGNGVSTATQNYSAMPQVARDPKGTIAPQNGTAEEAYVKERIRGAGYTGVNSLERDANGTWHALAYKGPADVEVALDQSGHITETAHQ